MIFDSFNHFFLNKRVLITGHTGFKGSWLSIWLHELGAKVVVANDAEGADVRITGVCLRFDPSQLHSRLWL
jgi:nucleoside-diphosphate-sugar epimerase